MPYVYILRCGDASYYVGSTRNLETRLEQHSIGGGGEYTRKRQPVSLVFAEEYDRVDEAWERGKQIQGWSRRKREALITGDFGRLPGLSKKRFDRKRFACWFRYGASRLLNPQTNASQFCGLSGRAATVSKLQPVTSR